jgi:hypothetical protein
VEYLSNEKGLDLEYSMGVVSVSWLSALFCFSD